MSRNYYRKLSAEIITENYQQKLLQKNYELVYQSRGKCEIYRDTGVSKNKQSYCEHPVCSYNLCTQLGFQTRV